MPGDSGQEVKPQDGIRLPGCGCRNMRRNNNSNHPADRRRRRPAALLGRCAGRRHVFALSGAVFGWLGGYHIKSKEALMTRNQKKQCRRERLLLLAAVILLALLLAVILR